MEFNYKYFFLQALSYTITIQILNFLNICLLYNGHITFVCYYLLLVFLDKFYMYGKLKNDRFVQILDLFDLYPLYLIIKKSSDQLWSNSIDSMIKLYLRFFFLSWMFQYNLFNNSDFPLLSEWLQSLILISYSCILLQTANVMYLSNTFKINFLNLYEFFPFLSVFLQSTSLLGLMTLFIISYSGFEFWIIIIIKLCIILGISYTIFDDRYELYNITEGKIKFILSSILVALSFISETSPFLRYGKSKKPDNYKDAKMCSQRTLLSIRIGQFFECLIYLTLYQKDSKIIAEYVQLKYFSYTILSIFLVYAVMSMFYFLECFRQYSHRNYEYFAQLRIDRQTATKIIQESKDFVFIEFNNVIYAESIDDNFWYFLLNKSFTPIPKIGFRKIIFGSQFSMNNTQIVLAKDVYLNIICDFYKNEKSLPPRDISFSTNLNQEEELKLGDCLIERLFEHGYCENTEMAFPIKKDQYSKMIKDFKFDIIQVISFYKIMAPHCSFFPQQIIFDLFDD